ncbi:MAG: molybdopterin converting factor subunit 1 [bacterium]
MDQAVQLRFFAGLREKIGTTTSELKLEKNTERLDKLVERIKNKYPEIKQEIDTTSVAVNMEIVRPEKTSVNPGDEIAFLPPFGGG